MTLRFNSWCSLHVVLMCGLFAIELVNEATGRSVPRHPQNLDKAVDAVLNHYNLTSRNWMGNAVFTEYLGKIETCTCEGLMYAAMLKKYEDIFADMLKNSTEVKEDLKYLKNNVTQLMRNYTKEQTVLNQLQEISLKDVESLKIQGGTVRDFRSVFDLASKGRLTVGLPVSAEEKMRRRAKKRKLGKPGKPGKQGVTKGAKGKPHFRRHCSMKHRRAEWV